MADDNEPRDSPTDGGGGLARGLSMPVRRVVSRILNVGDAPPASPASPEPGPEVWIVDCAAYVDGRRLPGHYSHTEALEVARREGGFVWLGLHEPTEAVSPRWLRRSVWTSSRSSRPSPPVTDRRSSGPAAVTLFVLRTTRYVEHSELTETSEVVETGDILVFVGDRFVITVRHGAPGALGPVRADLEQRPRAARPGAVGGRVRRLRPGGRHLPRGRRGRSRTTSTRSRSTCSAGSARGRSRTSTSSNGS